MNDSLKSTKPYLKTVERIISDNGEVLEEKQVMVSKDQFFYFYATLLGIWEKLEKSEIKIFAVCCFMSNNGEVYLLADNKKEIAKVTGLTYGTVCTIIPRIVKKGLLFKNPDTSARSGRYYIHPDYAWKGSKESRTRVLKIVQENAIKPNKNIDNLEDFG